MLRQDLIKYRSLFPHVSAALQLKEDGKPLTRGDLIQYIHTDAAHKNPLRRVTPSDPISKGKVPPVCVSVTDRLWPEIETLNWVLNEILALRQEEDGFYSNS